MTKSEAEQLNEIIEFLSGPEVWGALNQGQMQCSQCMTAYIGIEDVIARLKQMQGNAGT